MMHVKFDTNQIVKQIEKFASKVTDVDIDGIVYDALDSIADMLLSEMQSKVSSHKKKGRAYDALERTEVRRAANYQWVEVGALKIRAEHKDGFHIVYQEYGSPHFTADPWLRPTLEKNKPKISKLILEVFAQRGIGNVKAA